MFRKIIKSSFTFMIVILIALASTTVFAAQTSVNTKRLSGANRYATSSVVALSKWTQCDYAILAYGEDFPDALSAAPLAKKYNAPILLTETNTIPEETLNTIKQLKVNNIIIIGGTGIISSAVQDKLNSMGITTSRIFGQDRYETAIKIAEQLDNVNEIAIVTGESFTDALSISPIAVKRNMPIILVKHSEIPSVVTDYINSHKLTKIYVIGSGTSLNNSALAGLPNTELITGNDKYEINLNIAAMFKSDLDLSTIYLATGEDFSDALSGSVLAGLKSNPLVLIGGDINSAKNYFSDNASDISNINVLGGTGVIAEDTVNKLASACATPVPSENSIVSDIRFVSLKLTKVEDKTATFKYKVLDQNGADITKTVSFADINASAWVGEANAAVHLEPSTGTGTITYKFLSADEEVTVSLLYKNGLTATSVLYFDDTKAREATVAKEIDFAAANTIKIDSNSAMFNYKVLNKFGTDITKIIPSSEITADGSLASSIVLNPLLGMGTITYKASSDNGKPIAVTLTDKLTGIQTNVTMNAAGDPKVSKIELSTNELNVDSVNNYGYAVLRVYDQYGNEITNSDLAKDITINCAIGTVDKSQSGVIRITPFQGVVLSKLTKIRITANDPHTGVSMDVELNIAL